MAQPAILRPHELKTNDRGGGARTTPLVTRRCGSTSMINGITSFDPGAAIGVHFHNCEESVMVIEGEAIAEACLFDFEVAFEEGDFVAQRDDVFVGVVERVTEEVAEFGDHAIGFFDVDVHERADRVERVKEKVWIELGLQGAQFGLGETAFQLGCF